MLGAAVRAGYLSSEVKDWPYQVPVHGLTRSGWFIMAVTQQDRLVMHPQVDEAMRYLVKVKTDLTSIAAAKPRLAALNDIADPSLGFGAMMLRHLKVRMEYFPPHLPKEECVEFPLWAYGNPEDFSRVLVSFADKQMLLSELQMLPTSQDVIDVLADDLDLKTNRFEDLDTTELAKLCGIEPADGDANRVTYARWDGLDAGDQLHEYFAQMAPYVSPKRFEELQRWAGRIDEYEAEFDVGKLTKKEKEVLELLYNTKDCGDRSYWAVCTHHLKSRNGQTVAFQFCVGDGGDIEDSSGPYAFHEPSGFDCDDPDNLAHPKTGRRLKDLRWKAKG